MNTEAKTLIKIIKYTPFLIVLFTCLLMVTLMYQEKNRDLKKERLFIEQQYIQSEKERIEQTINTIHNYIKSEEEKTISKLHITLKKKVDIVHKIATNLYNKNKNTLSKKEIINLIKNVVETLRYDNGNGYFSIHTAKGINILQPVFREFEGTNILNKKDASGNYSVQQGIEIANTKGEGFLTWYSRKPDDKLKQFKKVGIVKKFKPYDLIITTGIFIDDYEKNLQNEVLHYLKIMRSKNKGFPFIINYDGDVILHLSDKILNHNIFKEKEFSQVTDFYRGYISNKNNQDGKYIIVKPTVSLGKDTKELKITYVKKFDNWKWVIGTNFKLSEANKIIEQRKIKLLKKYNTYIDNILLYGSIVTITLLFLSILIAKVVENKFLEYKRNHEEFTARELESKDKLLHKQEEFNNFFGLSINLQVIISIEGKIIQINNAAKDMIGYEQKELLNTSIIDLIHPDDVDRTVEAMIKLSDGKILYYFENRLIHKDGSYIHLAWSATTDKEHNIIYSTAQNTTESKLLQAEKEEKEKLLYQQSKMAAMGEMLGNIAHQWRQPLSLITTSTTGSKIKKEMDCLPDAEFYSSMDTINDAAQYLSQTIDDFRGFFNPKNNLMKISNTTHIIEKTFKLLNSQFIANNIVIIKDIKDCEFKTIENELIQVLINILNNARDILITKEKTKRLIFIKIYKKDEILYIEILDNAGGIEKDIISRVFEPYFTTKGKEQGTGIGLYMSYDIVQNHLNGTLTVSNEEYMYQDIQYKGAKFTIELKS